MKLANGFRIAAFGLLGFCGLLAALPTGALAQFAGGTIRGTLVDGSGHPVAGALVRAEGQQRSVRTTSDGAGRFAFAVLPPGTYTVSATAAGGSARARVEVGASGAELTLRIEALREIGRVVTARNAPTKAAGTDVTLDAAALQHLPTNGSFSETFIQLPGAVRGANGVVHINGDHGVINYNVDGVPIPQALNRQLGGEIDPSDVSYLEVDEGAWPAQYGLRFGSTLNIATRAGSGPAGFEGSLRGGSFASTDATLGYHAPIGAGGGFDVAVRSQRGERGLDPPNPDLSLIPI